MKDYKAILTVSELKKYLERCIQTGKAGFDWETAASEEIRAHYKKAFEDIEEACATGVIDDKEAESRSESLEKAYLKHHWIRGKVKYVLYLYQQPRTSQELFRSHIKLAKYLNRVWIGTKLENLY